MSNQTVRKYLIHRDNPGFAELLGGNCWVDIPLGAKILSVDHQAEEYLLWALVDPSEKETQLPLIIAPTGRNLSSYRIGELIGRVDIKTEPMIERYHVFHALDPEAEQVNDD